MKLISRFKALAAVFSLAVLPQFALAGPSGRAGGQGSGGGDVCENRIKSIRDDLQEWIVRGGSKALKLPAEITQATYASRMMYAIDAAQIKCVGPGDKGYPVKIKNTPKTCRFDRNGNSRLITCDVRKFMAYGESDQYVLIHHEYAGLAEIEIPVGESSKYVVSNQIAAHLQDQVVKKLVVRAREESEDIVPKNLSNIFNQPLTALSLDTVITRPWIKGLTFFNGTYQDGKSTWTLDESRPSCRASTLASRQDEANGPLEFKINSIRSFRVMDHAQIGKSGTNWTEMKLVAVGGSALIEIVCAKRSKSMFLPITIAEVQEAMGDEIAFDQISAKRVIRSESFDRMSPQEYAIRPLDIFGTKDRGQLRFTLPATDLRKNESDDGWLKGYVQDGRSVTTVDYAKPHAYVGIAMKPGEKLPEGRYDLSLKSIKSVDLAVANDRLTGADSHLIVRGLTHEGREVAIMFGSPNNRLPTYADFAVITGGNLVWAFGY